MNRAELQKLAQARIADAKALLLAKRWSGAYYLAGYAVECGLKSCVLVRLGGTPEVVFDDRRLSEKCWTHNLFQLVELAGLKAALAADSAVEPQLLYNWDLTKDWNESSRYRRTKKADAEELFNAVTDKGHGVMSWIKVRW